MNKTIMQGRLGQVPELKWSKAGKPYCTGTIAVPKHFDYKETNWFNFTAFGKTAERLAKCTKGQQVLFEGAIDIDVVDKNGSKAYYTKMIVDMFYYCGTKSEAVDNLQPAPGEWSTNIDADLPFE